MNKIDKAYSFYRSNQADLASRYNGRVIVIADDKVVGDFDSELDAYVTMSKTMEPESFMIQRCTVGDDRQYFHSRVLLVPENV